MSGTCQWVLTHDHLQLWRYSQHTGFAVNLCRLWLWQVCAYEIVGQLCMIFTIANRQRSVIFFSTKMNSRTIKSRLSVQVQLGLIPPTNPLYYPSLTEEDRRGQERIVASLRRKEVLVKQGKNHPTASTACLELPSFPLCAAADQVADTKPAFTEERHT